MKRKGMAESCQLVARKLPEGGENMFCVGSILSAVYYGKINGINQNDIVWTFYKSICPEHDWVSNEDASNVVRGSKNPSTYLMDAFNKLTSDDYGNIYLYFKDSVLNLIKDNELDQVVDTIIYMINDDDTIKAETVVDVISSKKKCELSVEMVVPESFLAGVFLFALKNTKNNVGGKVKKYTKECWHKVLAGERKIIGAKKTTVVEDDVKLTDHKSREIELLEEEIEQKATAFCINHDEEKCLIPLCQVARITNPTHKHVRGMYNEFCASTRSVQNRVLKLCDISLIDVNDSGWRGGYLKRFKEDYSKYQLGSERYEYAFGQYFPRLFQYGKKSIEKYTERIFPAKVKNTIIHSFKEIKHDVGGLIDEYMYYSKMDEYRDVLEPPMDYIWEALDFGGCDEYSLTVYLALFIIGTCYAIPREDLGKEFPNYDTPNLYEIETAEDLFYLTLLVLYETYE